MEQEWHDLLFAHWPVPPEVVRPHIPPGLTLETFDGAAWVGVVPFHMRGIRLRGGLPLLGAHAFAELNVRTYVRHGEHAGVWFFSLDAASRLAVWGARWLFHLPYFYADIRVHREDEGILYQSVRRDRRGHAARFTARYWPTGTPFQAQPNTIEYALTERYCLFAVDRRGRLYRGDIQHQPWPLQPAEAEIGENLMFPPAFPRPQGTPLLHFACFVHVRIRPPVRVS